ncbi:MAG: hypothetical protein GAK35_02308 [Herbaspirillum frisingense]|uniref:Uncharacterized protein n=1 Tax=Herbaspirillum frisingense TaxID=92645 RepID=A0A7V8JTX1_9BURK|nr:MAG: hypothetical protein GAK35_02308 [Herbaspirillum frisingense]
MKMLFNVAISVLVWLGLFQRDLVKPLLTLPLGEAISRVTFIDLGLLFITVVAVSAALEVFDKYLDSRKRRAVSSH